MKYLPCKRCKLCFPIAQFYKITSRGYLSYRCKSHTLFAVRLRVHTKFSNAWFSHAWHHKKRKARLHNIPFEMSFERFKELKASEQCSYCETPTPIVQIDRIDNTKGYTDANCIASCVPCNSGKRDKSIPDLERYINILRVMKERLGTP